MADLVDQITKSIKIVDSTHKPDISLLYVENDRINNYDLQFLARLNSEDVNITVVGGRLAIAVFDKGGDFYK